MTTHLFQWKITLNSKNIFKRLIVAPVTKKERISVVITGVKQKIGLENNQLVSDQYWV
jgi:hypothetical protein